VCWALAHPSTSVSVPNLCATTSWFKRTRTESHRIAELLAQLPAEIDMHAIVTEMLLKSKHPDDDNLQE